MQKNKIATITYSISHLEYIAQAVNPTNNLLNQEYKLGDFVKLGDSVGLVYDTELSNPNSIKISSQKEELNVFMPDFQDEIDLLLKISLIGSLKNKFGDQDDYSSTIQPGTDVYVMTDEEIKNFHRTESSNNLQIKYFAQLQNKSLSSHIFTVIAKKLKNVLPREDFEVIDLIRKKMQWESL